MSFYKINVEIVIEASGKESARARLAEHLNGSVDDGDLSAYRFQSAVVSENAKEIQVPKFDINNIFEYPLID